MKSRKLLGIVVMLVMVLDTLLLFSSCSKDDNIKTDEEQSIMVGNWKFPFGKIVTLY